jgi:RimJ/RimL family protein N-acetyltransferase
MPVELYIHSEAALVLRSKTANMATEFKIFASTDRLHLTWLDSTNPTHTAFIVTLFNDPHFTASEGRTGIDTPEKAAAFIRARCEPQVAALGYCRALLLRKPAAPHAAPHAAPEPVGIATLVRGTGPDDAAVPDVGFATLGAEAGKGYATEGARALVEYARRERGVEGVLGFADPGNPASARVLEKLGLRRRAVMKVAGFGVRESVVFASEDMVEDLSVYGLKAAE